jgi:hypothetical protein
VISRHGFDALGSALQTDDHNLLKLNQILTPRFGEVTFCFALKQDRLDHIYYPGRNFLTLAMSESPDVAHAKADFFRLLYEEDDADEVIDEGRLAMQAFLKRARKVERPVPSEGSSRNLSNDTPRSVAQRDLRRTINKSIAPVTPSILSRSVSAPEAFTQHDVAPDNETAGIKETPPQPAITALPGHLRRTTSVPSPLSKSFDMAPGAIPRAGGKRKRKMQIERVPEAQQIFKDRVFCMLSSPACI